jgi:proteasome lid subunit RPN8/RPN11
MVKLLRVHVEELFAHAREQNPAECCGLIGGGADGRARTIYRLRNTAADPLVAYEAAAADLFAAQRSIRQRGEQLLGIYHSHPRAREPEPSASDVRLAYYPSAIYFIIGLSGATATLRAFRIDESAGRWAVVDFDILDEREETN